MNRLAFTAYSLLILVFGIPCRADEGMAGDEEYWDWGVFPNLPELITSGNRIGPEDQPWMNSALYHFHGQTFYYYWANTYQPDDVGLICNWITMLTWNHKRWSNGMVSYFGYLWDPNQTRWRDVFCYVMHSGSGNYAASAIPIATGFHIQKGMNAIDESRYLSAFVTPSYGQYGPPTSDFSPKYDQYGTIAWQHPYGGGAVPYIRSLTMPCCESQRALYPDYPDPIQDLYRLGYDPVSGGVIRPVPPESLNSAPGVPLPKPVRNILETGVPNGLPGVMPLPMPNQEGKPVTVKDERSLLEKGIEPGDPTALDEVMEYYMGKAKDDLSSVGLATFKKFETTMSAMLQPIKDRTDRLAASARYPILAGNPGLSEPNDWLIPFPGFREEEELTIDGRIFVIGSPPFQEWVGEGSGPLGVALIHAKGYLYMLFKVMISFVLVFQLFKYETWKWALK